jgi:hypothetical protein
VAQGLLLRLQQLRRLHLTRNAAAASESALLLLLPSEALQQ